MRLGTCTPTHVAHKTRTTPTKVMASVVTVSQSYEERVATGTPSGSASQSEGACGVVEASGSKEASNSMEASVSKEASSSSSSDEAACADSNPAPQTGVPVLVSHLPNRWCIEGQY